MLHPYIGRVNILGRSSVVHPLLCWMTEGFVCQVELCSGEAAKCYSVFGPYQHCSSGYTSLRCGHLHMPQGEWVCAQASKDAETANWVCVEHRHLAAFRKMSSTESFHDLAALHLWNKVQHRFQALLQKEIEHNQRQKAVEFINGSSNNWIIVHVSTLRSSNAR